MHRYADEGVAIFRFHVCHGHYAAHAVATPGAGDLFGHDATSIGRHFSSGRGLVAICFHPYGVGKCLVFGNLRRAFDTEGIGASGLDLLVQGLGIYLSVTKLIFHSEAVDVGRGGIAYCP